MNAIRILIVDDHMVVRRGIRSLLSNYADFEIVGEAGDVATGSQQIQQLTPDVVLLDVRLPDESGLELLRQIRHDQLETRVLILTSFDDEEYITTALRDGADGYILKSVSDEMLCGAIRAVYRDERVLSPQVTEQIIQQFVMEQDKPAQVETGFSEAELEILRLLVNGASNDQIAAELYMSLTSVKRKLRIIFSKLNVQNRAQAAAEAVQRDLV
ncbi:MAG TPA: response regulator transcription factor [Aggregatilineales bacterium]|nr:response regulator transcription factor [Aggregatilineales bacterium]